MWQGLDTQGGVYLGNLLCAVRIAPSGVEGLRRLCPAEGSCHLSAIPSAVVGSAGGRALVDN